jgi:hypothetical protein
MPEREDLQFLAPVTTHQPTRERLQLLESWAATEARDGNWPHDVHLGTRLAPIHGGSDL